MLQLEDESKSKCLVCCGDVRDMLLSQAQPASPKPLWCVRVHSRGGGGGGERGGQGRCGPQPASGLRKSEKSLRVTVEGRGRLDTSPYAL